MHGGGWQQPLEGYGFMNPHFFFHFLSLCSVASDSSIEAARKSSVSSTRPPVDAEYCMWVMSVVSVREIEKTE